MKAVSSSGSDTIRTLLDTPGDRMNGPADDRFLRKHMPGSKLAAVLVPDGMAMDKGGAVTLAKGNITVLKSRFASWRE